MSSALLASPTGNLESVSSDEIVGPELPPIKESSKRLFLVRHGEVINPGKDFIRFNQYHRVHNP